MRVHVYDVCARPSLDLHPLSFYSRRVPSSPSYPHARQTANIARCADGGFSVSARSPRKFSSSFKIRPGKCEMNRVRGQRVRHGKTPRMIDLTWGISRRETLIHARNVRVHRSWIVREDGYVHTVMDTAQRDIRKLHIQSVCICAGRTSTRACRILYFRCPGIFWCSRENQFLRDEK